MIYIPNLLTLIRIGLVPWIVVLLQQQEFGFALSVFVIAGLTDGLDGYIAKRFDAQTFLGAILTDSNNSNINK
jgi:cardiolipin synthase